MKQIHVLIPLSLLFGLISCEKKSTGHSNDSENRIIVYLEKCSRAVKKVMVGKNDADGKKCFEVLNKTSQYESDMGIISSHVSAQKEHFSIDIEDNRGMKYNDNVLLNLNQ